MATTAAALCVSVPGLAARSMRVAVLPAQAGVGVEAGVALALTEAVAGEVARSGTEVITESQIKALLNHEATLQLVGCSDDACMAQIGEALGADALVTSSVARVDTSLLFSLRLVEVSTAASRLADVRLKGGTFDDVLDALPRLVAQLAPAGPTKAGPSQTGPSQTGPSRTGPSQRDAAKLVPPAVAAPSAALGGEDAASTERPQAGVEVTHGMATSRRERLRAATDGKGLIVVWDPTGEEPALFAGRSASVTPTRLYAQGVWSSFSNSAADELSMVFWDPRSTAGNGGSFEVRGASVALTCGPSPIALTPASLPPDAQFMERRWRRQVVALAHSDDFTWYVLDAPRAREDASGLRLWVGRRGALAHVAIEESSEVRGEHALLTARGLVKLSKGGAGAWIPPGEAAVPLTVLEPSEHRQLLYGDLRVYDEPLGTACEAALATPKPARR